MTVSERQIRKIEGRLSSLEETVEVLADKKLLLSIKRALDDIKQGRYSDYRDVTEFRADFNSAK